MDLIEKTEKRRITVQLPGRVIDDLDDLCRRAGLARDAYLIRVLPRELDRLEKCRKGDAEGMKFRRKSKEIEAIYEPTGWKRKPFTPTLSASLAERLDEVCAEKFIHRDVFLEQALQFLVLRLYPAVLRIEDPYSDLERDLDCAPEFGGGGLWFSDSDHYRSVNTDLMADDYYQKFIWNAEAAKAFLEGRFVDLKEYA